MILGDDAFARIVAEDVKNTAGAEHRAYLRATDVAPRWREALYALLENLDKQTASINTDEENDLVSVRELPSSERLEFETKEKHEFRRSKIVRFRFHVEQRLAEADRLILLEGDASGEMAVESFLRKAIERHYELMEEFGMDTNSIDESLYDAVKGRWTFEDITGLDEFE
jgi:hypothetical protein